MTTEEKKLEWSSDGNHTWASGDVRWTPSLVRFSEVCTRYAALLNEARSKDKQLGDLLGQANSLLAVSHPTIRVSAGQHEKMVYDQFIDDVIPVLDEIMGTTEKPWR